MVKSAHHPSRIVRLLVSCVAFATSACVVAAPRTVCLSHYALCSHAECAVDPKDNGRALCSCIQPGPNLNVGHSTCRERDDPEQTRAAFSLYDLARIHDKPALRAYHCTGKYRNHYARCLDAKCTPAAGKGTDASPKAAQCDCQLGRKPGDFYVMTADCGQPPEALCSKIWAAASREELEGERNSLVKYYAFPAGLEFCPEQR